MRTTTLIALVMLMVGPAWATDYYYSNAGLDSNNCTAQSGTPPVGPCKTLVDFTTRTWAAGSNIYFKRGDAWQEADGTTAVGPKLTISDAGTIGSHITLGAYGSGVDPIFRGAKAFTSANSQWVLDTGTTYILKSLAGGDPILLACTTGQVYGTTYTRYPQVGTYAALVANSVWCGDNGALGYNTIYWKTPSGAPPSSFHVPQYDYALLVQGTKYVDVTGIIFELAAQHGIYATFHDPTNALDLKGITFDDLEARYNGKTGINGNANNGGACAGAIAGHNVGYTVRNSWSHHNEESGYGFAGVLMTAYVNGSCTAIDLPVGDYIAGYQLSTGVLVEDNVFELNGFSDGFPSAVGAQDGAKVFYTDGTIFRRNTVSGNKGKGINFDGGRCCNEAGQNTPGSGGITQGTCTASGANGCSGTAVEAAISNNNSDISYNVIHGHEKSGILYEYYPHGGRIHHNYLYDNATADAGSGGISLVFAPHGVVIDHNVVIASGEKGAISLATPTPAGDGPSAGFIQGNGDAEWVTDNAVVFNTMDMNSNDKRCHTFETDTSGIIYENNVCLNITGAAWSWQVSTNTGTSTAGIPASLDWFLYTQDLGAVYRYTYSASTITLESARSTKGHGLHSLEVANSALAFVDSTNANLAIRNYHFTANPPIRANRRTQEYVLAHWGVDVYALGDFDGDPIDTCTPTIGAYEYP